MRTTADTCKGTTVWCIRTIVYFILKSSTRCRHRNRASWCCTRWIGHRCTYCHLVGDHYIHRVWCGTLSRCWCKDIRTTCCGADHCRIPCPCNIIVRCGRQCRCCTVLTQRPYLCKRRCHLVGDHYIHSVWCGTLSRC